MRPYICWLVFFLLIVELNHFRMKNRISLWGILFVFITFAVPGFAQQSEMQPAPATPQDLTRVDITAPPNFSKNFDIGLSYTRIDGESYVGIRLKPEFEIGKLGIGMSVPLYYNLDKGRLRTEAYSDWTAVLRIFRYVRYGQKRVDDFYVKVGDLTGAYIGYGLLLSNYSNAYSEDKRKIGFEWDIRFSEFLSIEGLYSDVNSQSFTLLALRPYTMPLRWTGIPIVETFETGVTYIMDADQTKAPNLGENKTYNRYLDKGVDALAFDMGLTLLESSFIRMNVYFQHAIISYSSAFLEKDLLTGSGTGSVLSEPEDPSTSFLGSGTSLGLNTSINFLADIFALGVRIDRLWYNDHFLPQFFDASYEINKDLRLIRLVGAKSRKGIYGNITGQILNAILIRGALLLPDNPSVSSPAMLNISASLDKFLGKMSLRLSYYKGNLESLSKALDMDGAVASLRVGYYPYEYLMVGIDYFRTFAKKSDESDGVVYGFVDQVSPFVSLQIPL